MSRLIKYLGISVFAVALLAFADASNAKAQGFSIQVGGFGVSSGHHHHSHGFRPSIRPSFRPSFRPSIRPSFGGHFGRPGYYHDTTHLDYHAPKLVPHNGHLDYVPGHYDVHRSGHWHH